MSNMLHPFSDEHDVSFEKSDYIQRMGVLPKSLLITLDATHAGYRNKNFFYYDSSAMQAAVESDTWTKPFAKPLLKNHDMEGEPLGRVEAARFITTGPDKGFTQLDVKVTDPDAIQKIVDGRYLTVSTHGAPSKSMSDYSFVTCSICGTDLLAVDDFCGHSRGMSYEDEDTGNTNVCYWTVGAMEYKEVSVVNTPADNDGNVAAQIVGIAMVDGEEPIIENIESTVTNMSIFADSEVVYANNTEFNESVIANQDLWTSVNKNKEEYVAQKGLLFTIDNENKTKDPEDDSKAGYPPNCKEGYTVKTVDGKKTCVAKSSKTKSSNTKSSKPKASYDSDKDNSSVDNSELNLDAVSEEMERFSEFLDDSEIKKCVCKNYPDLPACKESKKDTNVNSAKLKPLKKDKPIVKKDSNEDIEHLLESLIVCL